MTKNLGDYFDSDSGDMENDDLDLGLVNHPLTNGSWPVLKIFRQPKQ